MNRLIDHLDMTLTVFIGFRLSSGPTFPTIPTFFFTFDTPPHNSGGVLWFHVGCPCVCLSVRHPSVFGFRMIT